MPRRKTAAKDRYKNTAFLKALGEHCRRLRIQKGFSIDRMAREGEQLSTSVVHRLETGVGAVTASALLRYAQVLEVHPKVLFDFPFSYAEATGSMKLLAWDDPQARAAAFKRYLPVYSLKAAAGYFGRGEATEPLGWVDAGSVGSLDRDMFVVRAVGRSMLPRISDGDYAVFRANPAGTRQEKIVLAEYRGPADPETGGSYTIKKYSSVKIVAPDGQWRHKQIVLSPLNKEFEPIVLSPENENDFRIIGELVATLE